MALVSCPECNTKVSHKAKTFRILIVPLPGGAQTVEYGPHIPTLVEIAESGGLD